MDTTKIIANDPINTGAIVHKGLNPVQIGNATLHLGDCLDVLRTMPDNSVDSIVTDPPYGLSFMGKKWDYDVPAVAIWIECLSVIKPGGYLLAFASTRTQHRMACRIEDSGFEIRDMIPWVYSSGFPKSHNGEWGGTALKPALEPITMARKPLIGTVEANWREYGTGSLNIDSCRVGHADVLSIGSGGIPCRNDEQVPRGRSGQDSATARYSENGSTDFAATPGPRGGDPAGRWPANLIHDGSDEVIALFPQSAGQQGDVRGTEPSGVTNGIYGDFTGRVASAARNDTGSAARFFYCAKASKEDRNEGLNGFTAQTEQAHRRTNLETADNAYLRAVTERLNTHPTVKPTDLMRYLLRLVTPPHGVSMDLYLGSGSTGKAAMLEDFQFIGIERDPAYFAIACARIDNAKRQGHQPSFEFAEAA